MNSNLYSNHKNSSTVTHGLLMGILQHCSHLTMTENHQDYISSKTNYFYAQLIANTVLVNA